MKISYLKIKSVIRYGNKGFALISTLMIMVLLMVVAMAMFTLSSTTARTITSSGSGLEEARANARMALLEAIGQLQEQMGPDQRISANADIFSLNASGAIVSVANPHWMGVWDSWKAGVGENSQHSTIGVSDEMSPTYEAKRSDYFRGWLLSLNPDDLESDKATNASLAVTLSLDGMPEPTVDDTAIRLVGEGSLGSTASVLDYVSARLISISETTDSTKITGRYGWWIGDESQKARLMHDSYQNGTLTAADKIHRSQAPASMGNKVISGLEPISDEEQLNKLPSLKTLDLVDLDTSTAGGSPKISQLNFHNSTIHSQGVLADVREGGLKRDLSAILERSIDLAEDDDEFMLYSFDDPRFNDRSNSRVPIQDLAAYYQLYDNDPTWFNNRRGGVNYGSSMIATKSPNYNGSDNDKKWFQREYSAIYRQPVISKVQLLLAIGAQKVTDAERLKIKEEFEATGSQRKPMRDTDTHKLLLGVMPVITLWNPNNMPMILDQAQLLRFSTPPFALRWKKYRAGGEFHDFNYFNLNYAMGGTSVTSGAARKVEPYIIQYRFANSQEITFEPGEVKIFSAPTGFSGTLTDVGDIQNFGFQRTVIDPTNSWDPNGLFLVPRSTPQGSFGNEAPDAYNFNFDQEFGGRYDYRENMVFAEDDRITFEIVTEESNGNGSDGRRVSYASEVYGAGFNLQMLDYDFSGDGKEDHRRHYQLLSKHGSFNNGQDGEIVEFNKALIRKGFLDDAASISFTDKANSIPGVDIIGASEGGEFKGLMDFSLTYGCEVSSTSVGGFFGGRRVASRPFLHSPVSAAPFIDKIDKASLYNYGWDWQINKINDIEDSVIQADKDTGRTYYGGGYTVEAGTTHVVQREIPVLPPISIASFSHAHLGGFSLAQNNLIGRNSATDSFPYHKWPADRRVRLPVGTDFQQITATGQGGLSPHVVQAIGNSYAHPNIPAGRAFITNWNRHFDQNEDAVDVPFVDHSYLANKALWDEYFFSSITPQQGSVELYGGSGRTARQVASEFFKDGIALPNRRMVPLDKNMQEEQIDIMFTNYHLFRNGFADKIAAHLMVDGSFNINSTSEQAWKALFSSLRGKASVYLESGNSPDESTADGTVVSYGALPAAKPIESESITSPNTPVDQWKGGRELSDDEVEKLAISMVQQVKRRGPFLSLSEFVNRRLDDSNEEFALKGALQAAVDDPNVPINAPFREAGRMLDAETASIDFEFDAAADGPVAYGSAAYVDQADILRGLASQLTPRGDTFVIRSYGDSLSSDGRVVARAWCEAIVQRVPEYIDSADEAHVKHASLVSDANKSYGRKLKIISIRWLNADEI